MQQDNDSIRNDDSDQNGFTNDLYKGLRGVDSATAASTCASLVLIIMLVSLSISVLLTKSFVISS